MFRFYCIRCSETNEYYIGKTTQKLSTRLKQHKTLKNCTSKIITQYDSCVIILLEEVECTKEESVSIERQYIETYVCINTRIEGRTPKEYYQDNKVEINEKTKINRKKNPIKFAAIKKKSNIKNAVKVANYDKEYQQENKVELAKKRKERRLRRYTCECGKELSVNDKWQHNKTDFHINFCLNK